MIVVVGAGALGSHLVLLIRNIGEEIKVIDFDRVEQKNVLSQFHGKPTVSKLKVESLKQQMQYLFGTKLTTVSSKLGNDNVTQLLGGASLVVDCLDNGASRRVVQAYVRANNIPCLHGALAAKGEFGRSIWDERFVIDDEPAGGAPTCEDGEFLPFIALTASYLARSVQLFKTSGKKVGFSISPGGATVV